MARASDSFATGRKRALSRAFYARDTIAVARDLLGTRLISTIGGRRVEGRIVETEAYLGPHDPASHAAERIGRTQRNASMFGPPGGAYVYRIYGVHWCLNVVTETTGFPAAVLIRAVQPVRGLATMRSRRWNSSSPAADRQIANGPGKLAAAFGITRLQDGHDLRKPPLVIVPDLEIPAHYILNGPRIGVTRALDWPLRFYLADSPWVSRTTRR